MRNIVLDKSDQDYELMKYLANVRPSRSFRGIREDDMWTIISNVQKYYHEKTERIRSECCGIVKGIRVNGVRNG